MKFQRISTRRLPNGEVAAVHPFHICTKGERVVFRTSEDLRVAFNFLPICALRSNVAIVMPCVLNTHFHSVILARSYDDAKRFGDCYKQSVSMHLTRKYGAGLEPFREVESRPIPLEDDRYVRNAICYVAANALDAGATVDSYPWSGYRALFCDGSAGANSSRVSEMSRRKIREVLKSDICLETVPWLINGEGVIEPASYCDWRYAESAFYGDISFFTKVLGLTDRDQMDRQMTEDYQRRKSLEDVMSDIEGRCRKIYGLPASELRPSQKIPILKAVSYSAGLSVKILSRCFEMPEKEVAAILRRDR